MKCIQSEMYTIFKMYTKNCEMYTKILKCIQWLYYNPLKFIKLWNVYNLNARPKMSTILNHTNHVICIQIVKCILFANFIIALWNV